MSGQADGDRYLDGQGQDHCSESHDLSKIPDEKQINQRYMRSK
jgi:hypothetical protein